MSLPYVVRILLENVARRSPDALPAVLGRARSGTGGCEIPLHPDRIMLHDTTCLPALADIAALRDRVAELGGDPAAVNPAIPVDLVIDHSVIVEEWGTPTAPRRNLEIDFARNDERYRFVRWAEQSLSRFRVVPPGTGIIHQVNMESLARVVWTGDGPPHPELMLATDSHTPMINAMGVLGWGVGGIEAQSAMLGEPVTIQFPRVVGVRLTGSRGPGVTGTDLALTVTQRLRAYGVVGAFVEFCGALDEVPFADRATVANMAPEYGATCAYFPFDDQTLAYLRLTGRDETHCLLTDWHLREHDLRRTSDTPEPDYAEVVEIDLGAVEPSVAGPHRPDQRRPLSRVGESFRAEVGTPEARRSTAFAAPVPAGAVAIAAITSCTNTANPALMVAAGLLARNAVARGLSVPPWVKTSLSPGSRTVSAYLRAAGLLEPLARLGFDVVGYGCMTCIGNSGALQRDLAELVDDGLAAVAVLSGNRNFAGRVHPRLRLAYLASPPLVVAYALAGSIQHDMLHAPLGVAQDGVPVLLSDIWPGDDEVDAVVADHVVTAMFQAGNATVRDGTDAWRRLSVAGSTRFDWDPESTYVRRPPYVDGVARATLDVRGARILLWLGDDVTTDHISPAGTIPPDSAAGRYLRAAGVADRDMNQYSTRRSNHEVMLRGAFTNPSLRDLLGTRTPVFESAARHRAAGVDLVIVAGRNYGAGSSRDWAAKAPALLGVRAVIAEGFERIHRANLIGMGVLPLLFADAGPRGFAADDELDIVVPQPLRVGEQSVCLTVRHADGRDEDIDLLLRLDSRAEITYLEHAGVLPYTARRLARRTTLEACRQHARSPRNSQSRPPG